MAVSDEILIRGLKRLEALYRKTLTDAQIESYLSVLREWIEDEFDWDFAIKSWGQSLSYFPSAADLIAAIYGTLEDRAQSEWIGLEDGISNVGRKALKAIGGWTSYKRGGEEERKLFIRAYVHAGKGASKEDFELTPVAVAPPPSAPVLPPAVKTQEAAPDAPAPGTAIRPIPVLGGVSVNAELGIKTKEIYTQWEILLHRWYGACKLGTEAQRQKIRQKAAQWGREHLLPEIKPFADSRSTIQ